MLLLLFAEAETGGRGVKHLQSPNSQTRHLLEVERMSRDGCEGGWRHRAGNCMPCLPALGCEPGSGRPGAWYSQ